MSDRPFNVYQDVADEARADWLANRPDPDRPDPDEYEEDDPEGPRGEDLFDLVDDLRSEAKYKNRG